MSESDRKMEKTLEILRVTFYFNNIFCASRKKKQNIFTSSDIHSYIHSKTITFLFGFVRKINFSKNFIFEAIV